MQNPHSEEINSLNQEIEILKKQIEDKKSQHEIYIKRLENEVESIKNGVLNSKYTQPNNVSRVIDKIMEQKRKSTEEEANIQNDLKIQISQLRVQIAESNKKIVKHKSQNAELTIENLNYKSQINQLSLLYQRMGQDIHDSMQVFGERTSKINRLESSFYNKCILQLDKLKNQIPSLSQRIFAQKNFYDDLLEKGKHFSTDLQEYNYIIDHLIRSISFLTDVPLTKCPTANDVISNPDLLQKLIQHTYNASTTAKQVARSKLMASSLSLSQLLKPRVSNISLPVAKVLANLGAVSFDVVEKMEEKHRDTMTILDQSTSLTVKDISTMDFLSASNI